MAKRYEPKPALTFGLLYFPFSSLAAKLVPFKVILDEMKHLSATVCEDVTYGDVTLWTRGTFVPGFTWGGGWDILTYFVYFCVVSRARAVPAGWKCSAGRLCCEHRVLQGCGHGCPDHAPRSSSHPLHDG